MEAVTLAVLTLLRRYRDSVRALNGKRPIPSELDHIAFAVVSLCARCEVERDIEVLSAIQGCIDISLGVGEAESTDPYHVTKMPLEWRRTEAVVFEVARDLLLSAGPLEEHRVYDLLSTGESGIRYHATRAVWFFRMRANRDMVMISSFRNIADKLGYVDWSAALGSAVVGDDAEFFSLARLYEPSNRFVDQFFERIEEMELEGRLAQYRGDCFFKLEVAVRDIIEGAMATVECVSRIRRRKG